MNEDIEFYATGVIPDEPFIVVPGGGLIQAQYVEPMNYDLDDGTGNPHLSAGFIRDALDEARKVVLQILRGRAMVLGADAVVGVSFSDAIGYRCVSVSGIGTAVKFLSNQAGVVQA